jgi:hypothetical protein
MSDWATISASTYRYFKAQGITDSRALVALTDTFGRSTSEPSFVYVTEHLLLVGGDRDGGTFRAMLEAYMGSHIAPGVVDVLVSLYVSRANAVYTASAAVPAPTSE